MCVRPRVFENRETRKREKVTEDWRKLQHEELHD
jgi:hypothetical protein